MFLSLSLSFQIILEHSVISVKMLPLQMWRSFESLHFWFRHFQLYIFIISLLATWQWLPPIEYIFPPARTKSPSLTLSDTGFDPIDVHWLDICLASVTTVLPSFSVPKSGPLWTRYLDPSWSVATTWTKYVCSTQQNIVIQLFTGIKLCQVVNNNFSDKCNQTLNKKLRLSFED